MNDKIIESPIGTLAEYIKERHTEWNGSKEEWLDEGIVWAVQEYHSHKGSFSELDWSVISALGLTEVGEMCEENE